ncbi:MAG: hypothetical protein ACN0LA_05275 [Candidatus Longimicrobiales bacterium M2_2A_002]
MIGDLFYRLGTVAGTGLGVIRSRIPPVDDGAGPAGSDPDDTGGAAEDESGGGPEDGDFLVDSILGGAAAWVVKTALRPKSVSWPRVVVAGIGATVLADLAARTLGSDSDDRSRPYGEDPDALLVRLGSGIAMAAGYAALLYPRLPGSPMTKGLIFGAMEVAAAPHGGLVRVATDTPGLKFPLKDLAVPIDDDAGPLANVAFGVGLGLLYRPPLHDDSHDHEDQDE